ncbi:MAG TPA: ABC transporter ATP-binding protein, partial [Phototrophicaceae bacterium]|nr:ABC transporter ATP-binding protein [Phototrophicaceae bacterium]
MSIVLDHISKNYGTQAIVRDVSLEIEQGELFVLLGPSGSGKSTILRMIAGLSSVDDGRIHLNGRDVTKTKTQKRGVGFVFQNYSLFQHMTVAQNIAFGLEIQKVPRPERDQRVRELLELIDLAALGDRTPSQLSGGQQQRVAVARALAQRPEVLLLDEPFGALDVKIRAQLRHNLREIQQRLNVTAILVTHDQDEAFELADRIGIIDGGRLLEVGTPAQLYRKPEHRFTATFIGN